MTLKTRISQLGGLVAAHYRFTDNPAFVGRRGRGFRNIAPAGREFPVSDAEIISVGGPTFMAMTGAGAQGLKLDNSCHLRLPSALAWQGMILIAGQAFLPDATHDLPILIFDTTANVQTVGHVRVTKASGVCNLRVNNATYAANTMPITHNVPFVAMAGFDQDGGKAVNTLTGIAPYAEANPSSTSLVSGWPLSPSGDQDLIMGRLLNSASETPQTGYFILHEMAFLIRRPTAAADLATTQGVFETTKARLGI